MTKFHAILRFRVVRSLYAAISPLASPQLSRPPNKLGRRAALCLMLAAIACGVCARAAAQANEWTWMGGSDNAGSISGVYGTLGTAAAGNVPGSRDNSASWTDSSGHFWLFGGYGRDSTSHTYQTYLNDMWEFSPITNEWTWKGGSSVTNITSSCNSGVYGTLGTPAATNIPGGRSDASKWTDNSGHLWLFGGTGCDSASGMGQLNDLWEFNPSTNQWAWISGSSTDPFPSGGRPGVYGTMGTPATSNVPGGRYGAVSWTDSSGNLWLFGGSGNDANGNYGFLNDLWEFNPSLGTYGEWAWMGGSSTIPGYKEGNSGVYGTLGAPVAGNIPGGRDNSVSWTDSSGHLWLFGGYGSDASGIMGYLNDMWEFNPSLGTYGEWAWMGGNSSTSCHLVGLYPNQTTVCRSGGVYGTLGVPAAGNIPGGRELTVSWTDSSGNFWLFGGHAGNVGTVVNIDGVLSDLWMFNLSTNEWTCTVTSNPNTPGVNTALGTPAAGNIPGSRDSAVSWTGSSGNLWLFGGFGVGSNATGSGSFSISDLNDLWEYQPFPIAATPTFSVAAGTYTSTQTVSISDTTPGATIYYTTDGTTPTTSSPVYSGAITVSSTETLQAIATATGYSPSAVQSAAYTINLSAAATPTFNVAAGTYTTVQTVTISDTTPGATIYYTTNGTTPTISSTKYTGAISVSSSETLEAIATASGYSTSAVQSAAYTINLSAAATPTFNVAAGTYTTVQTVTISDTTPGATIYYTTNGTTPTTSSSVYSGAITVSSSETLEAIATATGYSTSAVASAAYTINLPAATPTFSVAAGTYTTVQTVTISDTTPSATIYYTTNGTTPTTSSSVYTGAISVSTTETLEAIATATGYSTSAVQSAAYTINLPVAATPTFSVAAGTYTSTQTVTISDTTTGATIYYTTNGTTPTTSSTKYTGAISVSTTETLEAIATATGYATSAVQTAAYTINLPAATPTFSVAAGTYTTVQTVTISDTTTGATIYYTTNGTTPTTSSSVYSGAITVSSTETLEAIATATGYSTSAVASAAYTINIPTNPVPAISGISPAFTNAGGTVFTLTVNGSGFITGSTVYWGTSALTTTYVSATQLTAQVPAADIAAVGTIAITVQTPTPGGGTSNAWQFEVDSVSSGSTAPTITSTTETVAAGSTASYPVTMPSSVTSVSISCLNLPTGASCSYSSTTNTVTITTSSTTPKGTYQITVVFTETVTGAAFLLPILLLPLGFMRKKLAARGIWLTACLGLVLMATAALSIGCGGGSSGGSGSTTPPATHQVTSSGAVSLTIQ